MQFLANKNAGIQPRRSLAPRIWHINCRTLLPVRRFLSNLLRTSASSSHEARDPNNEICTAASSFSPLFHANDKETIHTRRRRDRAHRAFYFAPVILSEQRRRLLFARQFHKSAWADNKTVPWDEHDFSASISDQNSNFIIFLLDRYCAVIPTRTRQVEQGENRHAWLFNKYLLRLPSDDPRRDGHLSKRSSLTIFSTLSHFVAKFYGKS